MLSDHPRTQAYWNAINVNKAIFQDKIVIDVGAGTGKYLIFLVLRNICILFLWKSYGR